MPAVPADRNLLFGILAVLFDFVSRDDLITAMSAWLLDKGKPLGEIFREQGKLSAEELQHLDALVDVHLRRHGGEPQKSLAALSSVPSALLQRLAALPDDAVQCSVAHVASEKHGPPPEPDPNRTIPQPPPEKVRYRILRPHARGGLGEVFVAEDAELGRNVAVKEIQSRFAADAVSRERFVREAEITGGLEHPGIVPVYGLGTYADGRPFYAMRFIKGDNLKQATKLFHGQPGSSPSHRFDSIEFRQLLQRLIDVCNAVAYAHSRGVLHRDLKPGNIMLGKYGETLVVDWGLAKPAVRAGNVGNSGDEPTLMPRSGGESSATVAGQALGTPAYMSPEQAAGRWDELGPASDIYSLGATLYELLTGRVPFPDFDLDAVQKGHFPPPRSVNPAVPRALEAVCLKAMALKSADRYAAAQEIAKEIERWLADEPVAARPEPLNARVRRWVRKHSRLVTAMGMALLVGVAAIGALAWQSERARVTIGAKEAETASALERATAARKRTREALDVMTSQVATDWLASQRAVLPQQKAFLDTALTYYREFAEEKADDAEGREAVARSLARVGYMQSALGNKVEAEAAYTRAIELLRPLSSESPTNLRILRELADRYNSVCLLRADLERWTEAES
jgi:serine/threonine-protein kinase